MSKKSMGGQESYFSSISPPVSNSSAGIRFVGGQAVASINTIVEIGVVAWLCVRSFSDSFSDFFMYCR